MQIKGLAIYRFLISGQAFKPPDRWVRKANVLLAFWEAFLTRFSNHPSAAVFATVNRPSLALAIEQKKEYRSS